MPKLTPNRTFLLRQVDNGDGTKKDVVARKGVKVDVTDSEHFRLRMYFVEPYAKKKALTVN